MKRFLRLLLLLLVAVLALSTFVGCDEVENNTEDTLEEEEEAEDFFPDIERKDYNMDFNIFMAPSTMTDFYYMDDDRNDGSPMDESVYNRQEKVQRFLGIEIIAIEIADARFDNYNK